MKMSFHGLLFQPPKLCAAISFVRNLAQKAKMLLFATEDPLASCRIYFLTPIPPLFMLSIIPSSQVFSLVIAGAATALHGLLCLNLALA